MAYAGGGAGGGGGGAWGTSFSQPTDEITARASTQFYTPLVDQYLDAGASYEQIAAETGYNYDWIQQHADRTRPGYGVTTQGTSTTGTGSINTGTGSGSGISGPSDSQKQQWINAAYDTKLNGLREQMDTINPRQQAAIRNINQGFGSATKKLQVQNDQGVRNLNESQQQIEGNRERNLKYLRDWMRNQSISKANQLGNMGAGDSSAMGLVNFALGQQVGQERSNTMGNASDQLRQLGFQRDDLQTSFNQAKSDLDVWKQTNLDDIAMKFQQIKANIQNEMAQADVDRYAQLAQIDASVTQDAINALSQLDANYTQQAQDLVAAYDKQFQIDPAFAQAAQGFQAQNIGVSPESFNLPPQLNPEAPALAVRRRDEEDNLI